MFAGKRVVYCAGTWDLFHIGHLNMIKRSREHAYGGILVVGVTSDEHTADYKNQRPFIPFVDRFEIVSALEYPDVVVRQDVQFDIDHMKSLHVDEVILGMDWAIKMPPNLRELMKHVDVYFLPRTEGVSTSDIKHKLRGL